MWNDNRGDGLWYKPPIDFEERLWKVQIKSWEKFAHIYFSEASRRIQGFSDTLLEETCLEPSIRSKIRRYLQEQKLMALSRAEKELATIVNELGRMKTCHRTFKEWLQSSQRDLNQFFYYIIDNKLRQVISTYQNLHYFQFAALWRFLDNVIIQVVERHLLGPSGLVFCFSIDWVRSLSEKQLDDLVGEDAEQRKKRDDLQNQIRGLEQILRDSEALQSK
ncbi:uncharacterized protein PFLUO_LOCUS8347 [Penicillium psychrofluorescens]|uniref:uncharacterized protein n=1 Tax=Penicillium psychrofluorescens TaxID=3158075 RepID=UPI003CCCE5CD